MPSFKARNVKTHDGGDVEVDMMELDDEEDLTSEVVRLNGRERRLLKSLIIGSAAEKKSNVRRLWRRDTGKEFTLVKSEAAKLIGLPMFSTRPVAIPKRPSIKCVECTATEGKERLLSLPVMLALPTRILEQDEEIGGKQYKAGDEVEDPAMTREFLEEEWSIHYLGFHPQQGLMRLYDKLPQTQESYRIRYRDQQAGPRVAV